MRIISGTLKGRRFTPPTKLKARPTTDFAKEGLFNVLAGKIDFEDIKVLELFAGSGSIGLEFVSRGAESVVGIELSHTHIGYIKKVCTELDVKNYFLQKADVFKYLESAKGSYDVIFADPPYAIKDLDKLPDLVLNNNLLNEDGIFILEHGRDYDFSAHPHFIEMRKYGNVHFSFFANAKNS